MTRIRATFGSLIIRNYRLFFSGQAVSQVGSWMQKTAQAWLVLEMTGSGTLLGVTAALQHAPTLLLSPWAGLLADRFSKRKLLLWSQGIASVLALLLGILVASSRIELWMILVLALALGATEALDKPARHTFVVEMVGSNHLMNALTLNQVVTNVGKVVGPAIAGMVITQAGLAAAFLTNAGSYLIALVGLWMIRATELKASASAGRRKGQLREGWRYVRGTPELLGPLALMTVAGTLSYVWSVSLPLLATDAFRGSAQTFALMFSAMGLGAVSGGLLVAGSLKPSVRALMTTAAIFSALVVATAWSPTLSVALVCIVLLGGASIAFKTVLTTLLQLVSAPEMRGRVMALLVIATGGTTTLGGPLFGWLAETIGVRFAIAQGGVATAIAAMATYLYLRWTHRLQSVQASVDYGVGADIRVAHVNISHE